MKHVVHLPVESKSLPTNKMRCSLETPTPHPWKRMASQREQRWKKPASTSETSPEDMPRFVAWLGYSMMNIHSPGQYSFPWSHRANSGLLIWTNKATSVICTDGHRWGPPVAPAGARDAQQYIVERERRWDLGVVTLGAWLAVVHRRGEDSGRARLRGEETPQTTSLRVHKSQITTPHSSCHNSLGPGASQRQTV